MITELTTIEYKCDICYTSTIEQRPQHNKQQLPENWTSRASSGHGLTNYTKTYHVCPNCKHKDI